jgi:shikimate kinase
LNAKNLLFLVGFMGSGKSWWGRRLGEHTGLPFIDLDSEIEIIESMDIPAVLREKGEAHFREREREVLESIAARHQTPDDGDRESALPWKAIVATGGGAPCFSDNMDWMNAHGFTVWLNPSVEVLCKRLEKETAGRPLLKDVDKDGLEDMIRLRLAQRAPFYGKADLILEETDIPVREFLKMIAYA